MISLQIDRQRLLEALEDAEKAYGLHRKEDVPKAALERDAYYRKQDRLRAAVDAARKSMLEANKTAFTEVRDAFYYAKQFQKKPEGPE